MGLDTETFMCMVMMIITKNTTFNNTRTIFSSPPFMLQQIEMQMTGMQVENNVIGADVTFC
jgi:hypothetical protein